MAKRTLWEKFQQDVLDYETPEKDKHEAILDLVGRVTSLRYAHAQAKSGAKPVGYTYWHLGSLMVEVIYAAESYEISLDEPEAQEVSVYSLCRGLFKDGISKDNLQACLGYVFSVAEDLGLNMAKVFQRAANSLTYRHREE